MSAAVQREYPELMTLAEAVDNTGLSAETFRLLAALDMGRAATEWCAVEVYRTTDLDRWRSAVERQCADEEKPAVCRVLDWFREVRESYDCC